MEFFEVVKKRQSYRGGFENKSIPRGDLKKIVQAGLDAPSGKNAQTTQFVMVDDAAIVRTIAAMHPTNKAVQQAQAYIACITDRHPEAVFEGMSFQLEDCAAAVENMLLAIAALGYASVWIDGWLRLDNRADTIGKLLGLPAGKILQILLPIGVATETMARPAKKPFADRAWFNAYGRGQ